VSSRILLSSSRSRGTDIALSNCNIPGVAVPVEGGVGIIEDFASIPEVAFTAEDGDDIVKDLTELLQILG
jgi:hypothetical protein